MESVTYERIKELCEENGITINKLEAILEFGKSSIQKWKSSNAPSVDKLIKIANYFGVSTDYLLDRTDIKEPISDMFADKDIISFQRAKSKMSERDKERMMALLRIGFETAFSED